MLALLLHVFVQKMHFYKIFYTIVKINTNIFDKNRPCSNKFFKFVDVTYYQILLRSIFSALDI